MDGICVNKKCPANANKEKQYKNFEFVFSWLSPLFSMTVKMTLKKEGEEVNINLQDFMRPSRPENLRILFKNVHGVYSSISCLSLCFLFRYLY